jgi:hypothetical protein
MPRVNQFQKQRQRARNIIILHLAKEGYKLREISAEVKKRYRDDLTTSRIHKIISNMLAEEGEQNERS